jgi:hypothetical protein
MTLCPAVVRARSLSEEMTIIAMARSLLSLEIGWRSFEVCRMDAYIVHGFSAHERERYDGEAFRRERLRQKIMGESA